MKKTVTTLMAIIISFCAFSQNWLLTGNSGTTPGTNFLGTTDAQRLVFRTSNLERMTILSNGNAGIGTSTPITPLHISSNTTDVFLRLSGNGPSVQFVDSPAANTNRLGKLAYASGSAQYVGTAVVGDFILQNLDSVGSLIFGTNAVTGNGLERARITSKGLFGIGTTTPTARLDVQSSGATNASNIRFENLQAGSGTVLVIDANGYVMKSSTGVSAATAPTTPLSTDLQSQVEELKSQVQELRSLLAARLSLTPSQANSLNNKSASFLGDIHPNPASGITVIDYSLPSDVSAASCQVYSLDGRSVTTLALPSSAGKNQVQLNTSQFPAGIYMYALVINGKVLDTKKLVISK